MTENAHFTKEKAALWQPSIVYQIQRRHTIGYLVTKWGMAHMSGRGCKQIKGGHPRRLARDSFLCRFMTRYKATGVRSEMEQRETTREKKNCTKSQSSGSPDHTTPHTPWGIWSLKTNVVNNKRQMPKKTHSASSALGLSHDTSKLLLWRTWNFSFLRPCLLYSRLVLNLQKFIPNKVLLQSYSFIAAQRIEFSFSFMTVDFPLLLPREGPRPFAVCFLSKYPQN